MNFRLLGLALPCVLLGTVSSAAASGLSWVPEGATLTVTKQQQATANGVQINLAQQPYIDLALPNSVSGGSFLQYEIGGTPLEEQGDEEIFNRIQELDQGAE